MIKLDCLIDRTRLDYRICPHVAQVNLIKFPINNINFHCPIRGVELYYVFKYGWYTI